MQTTRWLLTIGLFSVLSVPSQAKDLRVLFLGDNGHHQPRARFAQLEPVLRGKGIRLDYTDNVADLNAETLADYEAVALYANIDAIEKPQADALLEYVASGKGFIPIHCATYCFRNDERIVALMGGQFQRHGTGTFRTELAQPEHPIMRGFGGFESWDETYVHHKHNEKNRTVLAFRVDDEGREPWTWVRTHGKGRVFYTAWGHDHRTFGNRGFQNLMERGIRWAAGDDPAIAGEYMKDIPFPVPEMTKPGVGAKPLEYIEVGPKIPNYTAGKSWGTQGDVITKMQKPLPPEESMKHISVPKGFRVELFVSEPDLKGKPIAMSWDERGRLWVCETYDYPNELQPKGKGRDRIRICEDTDGDWKADKFTVFAEKLSIPTAITFANGGAIVQNGTETLFLKDTDGDDVADERKVLFTGWALGDTHGGVSNFQYGLDNWIWAMQGYNNSRPVPGENPRSGRGNESPNAGKDSGLVASSTTRKPAPQAQTFRQGFFRFKPDGSEIEFIRSTNNNTWGLGISEEGLIFGSTANGCPSVFMPIPNRYYERVKGWRKSLVLQNIAPDYKYKPITKNVRQVDWHGGFTAAAGSAIYTARRYPKEYWNQVAFVCGPTGHLVAGFHLKPDGAGFKSKNEFNLFASTDEWTAPIMADVGPDGNVWVLDWYNYIVQHNPTPQGFKTGKGNAYETDLRDKKHGRIYRVVYGDDPKPMSLAGADPSTLVKTLSHPTMLWRKHAQRLLVESGKKFVRKPLEEIAHRNVDQTDIDVGAIHAIATLAGLDPGKQNNRLADNMRSHKSTAVRRVGLSLLGNPVPWGVPAEDGSDDGYTHIALFKDPDPQVRLAAFLLHTEDEAVQSGRAKGYGPATHLTRALSRPENLSDPLLNDALIAAASAEAAQFLDAVARQPIMPNENVERFITTVAEHAVRTDPGCVSRVLSECHDKKASAEIVHAIVLGFDRGWPSKRGRYRPGSETAAKCLAILGTLPPEYRGVFAKFLSGSPMFAENISRIVSRLLLRVEDNSVPLEDRARLAQEIIELQPNRVASVKALLDLVSPQTPTDLASALITAAGRSEANEAPAIIITKAGSLTPNTKRVAIGSLLTRTASTRALLDAVSEGQLQLGDLSLDQRQALSSHPDRSVRDLAKKVFAKTGGLTNPDRQKVLAELMAVCDMKGTKDAGKAMFKKHCAKCHMHSGEGIKVGPDLTGMAVHPKKELLGHILDPSASVEGNYRLYSVITDDGKAINGMLAAESRTTLELIDTEGKKQSVLREEIDEMVSTKKSVMPEGFEKLMSKQEFADLLTFLTDRGKFLPIDISKVASVASDRGMFFNKNANVERLIFPDWKPKVFNNVPFVLIDPQGGTVPNTILLHGPATPLVQRMPKRVELLVNGPVRAIHMLGGVGGWAYPYNRDETVSVIVRLHYADGSTEDHELKNGIHFADYIRRADVKGSEFAFQLRGQQIRYLAVYPKKSEPIQRMELIKGPDGTAPVLMAITAEAP